MIFTSSVPANIRVPVIITDYLARRFTYHDVSQWAKIVHEGRIRINGEVCGVHSAVAGDDTISYDPGDFDEPDADLSYTIIYEDDWTIGVCKPKNLLVHRAGRSFRNNLVYLLRHVNTPPYPECHPVHRLDKDTSGVVLFAKDAEQKAVFGKLFDEGKVIKTYKAVVDGCPDIELPFTIDAPISADKERSYKFKAGMHENGDGKPAVTIIDAIQCLDDGRSVLTVRPLTGRTHQIRVHLASIGFPVFGDWLYGREESSRLALHCESLSFTHPHTGSRCEIKSDIY